MIDYKPTKEIRQLVRKIKEDFARFKKLQKESSACGCWACMVGSFEKS